MKKKGFTLIELLAVIVILGIITVIAVPKVLDIINKSKESAASSSIKLVKDAIKTQIASSDLTGPIFTKETDGCYLFDFDDQASGNVEILEIKNKDKVSGSIKYCNNTFSDDTLEFNNGNSSTKKVICKRAKILHTEECAKTDNSSYCSSDGYTTSGSKKTTTVTYGNLGTKGVLTSGDAFDCDVNGDGIYDPNTERFYYVSDYYNTSTKAFESDTAVLIYYNDVNAGNPAVNEPDKFVNLFSYYGGDQNRYGPLTAMEQLPTTEQWSNVSLKNEKRAILNEKEGDTITYGSTFQLPTEYSYAGYAARLLTIQEVKKAAENSNLPTWQNGELSNQNYLFENTIYSNDSRTLAWWLETPQSDHYSMIYHVNGIGRKIDHYSSNSFSSAGVRPAIEVSKKDINY